MSDDIVERLREFAAKGAGVSVLIDAVAEIERLREENRKMRYGLRRLERKD